jgi:hypothetical protein
MKTNTLLASALLAALALPACQRNDTTSYDPRIDGILSQGLPAPDLSILGDQKALHKVSSGSSASVSPSPSPARTGPLEPPREAPPVMAPPDVGTQPASDATPASARQSATIDAATGSIVLADGTMIPAPAEGFKWTVAGSSEDSPVPGQRFQARKQGTGLNVQFVIIYKKIASDQDRAEGIKYTRDAIVSEAKKLGIFTNISAPELSLPTPIPDRYTFQVTASTGKGIDLFQKTLMIFGPQCSYAVEVFATSEQEADSFLRIADSVK